MFVEYSGSGDRDHSWEKERSSFGEICFLRGVEIEKVN